MNKQRGIIIGILALAVTMMVGYALFSETITINGTATAKGSFDITATCTPGITNAGFINATALAYVHKNDNNYKNDSCSVNGNKITHSAELQQPGAVRNFTVKMTNSGTIDAVFDVTGGITTTYQSCVGNYDTGEFSNCSTEGPQSYNRVETIHKMNDISIVGFEKSDGTIIPATESNSNEFLNFLDENQEKIILKPGESMYAIATSKWENLGNEIESSQKVLFKEISTLEFEFNQSTN